MQPIKTFKTFITYAHEDEEDKKKLDKHLAVMIKNKQISIWSDSELTSGDKWETAINKKLNASDLVLYLVSRDSLASDACNKEFSHALNQDMVIIPIILRECDWKNDSELSEIQALPKNCKPIHSWGNEDEAWQNVVEGIRRKITKQQRSNDKPPDDTQQLFGMANMCIILGQYRLAIAHYDQAIAINPSAEAYNNRGVTRNALGDHSGAIADYNKALEINPKYAEAYNNRGLAKNNLDKHQDVIKDYDQAIKFNPQLTEAYFSRGIAQAKLGKPQDAIDDFDQAIKINPQYAKAYYNRGIAKNNLGKYQDAIKDFDQAIKINPQFANAYLNRGYAKAALGDHQGALADANKALEINPQDAKALKLFELVKKKLQNKN